MNTTVLVPLDGSSDARAALPYGEAMARALNGSVRLLSVIERRPDGDAPPSAPRDYAEATILDGLTNELAECAARLRQGVLTVSTEVAYGDPASEILAAADAADVAMTVMSTHGAGVLDRLLVGSVADKVMRMSTRPTLLVSPFGLGAERPSVAIARVVAPLDGSRLAESALSLAESLTARAGARLTLVRVEAPASLGATPYTTAGDRDRLQDEVDAEARGYLEKIRGGLSAPERADVIVLRGQAAEAVTDYAIRAAVDLVVMATHGRGGLRRLVLGSTADRLVRSGVPVLLVRPSQRAAAGAWSPELATRCAACGRLISTVPEAEARCPRCQRHLHACINCVYWDTTGCVLQRAEAHTAIWPGRNCPQFTFRLSARPVGSPHMTEVDATVAEAP